MSRHLFHLALAADWHDAESDGHYRVSTRGRTLAEEGFIHASFAHQVDGVARRFYADVEEPLVLLTIDLARVDVEVRLEVPPGADEAFPHLYGPLPVDAVSWVTPYELPPITQVRFHHAHLFASDLDATVDFYRRWFGARVEADEVLVGSRNVMVVLGDGRLNFYDQPPRDRGRGAVHHLGLQVRDLASLVDRMRAGGVSFRKPIAEGEGFRYVMVEAPDGLLLELFESDEATMPPPAARWFGWS